MKYYVIIYQSLAGLEWFKSID